jgi:hypothetical protein
MEKFKLSGSEEEVETIFKNKIGSKFKEIPK